MSNKELSLRRIADELINNVDTKTGKYRLLDGSVTGNGNGTDASDVVIVPFSDWRVVACGVWFANAGASTVAEITEIGTLVSDGTPTQTNYFAHWAQDVTAGKNWAAGDMLARISSDILFIPAANPAANGGTHTMTAGTPDGFNVWQYGQGAIAFTKKNVGGSTATVNGWVLVEVI